MKDVVGSMMEIDTASNAVVSHLEEWHANHSLEIGEHASEHVLSASIEPSRHHRVSEEVQSLRSLASRSRPPDVSSSSRSLRQDTPGSLLNHVRSLVA